MCLRGIGLNVGSVQMRQSKNEICPTQECRLLPCAPVLSFSSLSPSSEYVILVSVKSITGSRREIRTAVLLRTENRKDLLIGYSQQCRGKVVLIARKFSRYTHCFSSSISSPHSNATLSTQICVSTILEFDCFQKITLPVHILLLNFLHKMSYKFLIIYLPLPFL